VASRQISRCFTLPPREAAAEAVADTSASPARLATTLTVGEGGGCFTNVMIYDWTTWTTLGRILKLHHLPGLSSGIGVPRGMTGRWRAGPVRTPGLQDAKGDVTRAGSSAGREARPWSPVPGDAECGRRVDGAEF
jgi:hypothetical protein